MKGLKGTIKGSTYLSKIVPGLKKKDREGRKKHLRGEGKEPYKILKNLPSLDITSRHVMSPYPPGQ